MVWNKSGGKFKASVTGRLTLAVLEVHSEMINKKETNNLEKVINCVEDHKYG